MGVGIGVGRQVSDRALGGMTVVVARSCSTQSNNEGRVGNSQRDAGEGGRSTWSDGGFVGADGV